MANASSLNPKHGDAYEIHLKGILEDQWKDWFDGMDIYDDSEGNTILTGAVVDQAALHGLLDKVRDLGITLLSVTRLDRKNPVNNLGKKR